MQLNLLFLPLLGGYVFYCKWHGTRFYATRCPAHRILLHAAAYGLVLLVVARLLVMATPVVFRYEQTAVPLAQYAALGCLVSLLLALGLVAWDRRRSTELREELGAQKLLMGFLIATISLAALGFLFVGVDKDDIRRSIAGGMAAALVATLLCAGTATLSREFIRQLEVSLYHRLRFSAMFLRMSLLAFMLCLLLLAWTTSASFIGALWQAFSPYEDSGTAFLACMLGALSWWPLNLALPFQVSNARLYREQKTTALERLLYLAARDSSQIQVTMKDGKVYVGVVAAVPPDPAAPDEYMQILPHMSGYRDSETKKVVFTTFYDEAYEMEDVRPEDFVKLLPVERVESAGIFRADVYLHFLKTDASNVQPPATAAANETTEDETTSAA